MILAVPGFLIGSLFTFNLSGHMTVFSEFSVILSSSFESQLFNEDALILHFGMSRVLTKQEYYTTLCIGKQRALSREIMC